MNFILKIVASFTGLFDSFKKDKPNYFVINDFLSHSDCQRVIDIIELIEFKKAKQYDKGRHNSEIFTSDLTIDKILTDKLYKLKFKGLRLTQFTYPFEFYRYKTNDYISRHSDSSRELKNGEYSNYTLVLYLNDDFIGGETFFNEMDIRIKPKQGDALFFRQHLAHEGVKVTEGSKYIFRTNCLLK